MGELMHRDVQSAKEPSFYSRNLYHIKKRGTEPLPLDYQLDLSAFLSNLAIKSPDCV